MPPVRSTSTSQTKRPRPPFNPPRPRNTGAGAHDEVQSAKASKSQRRQANKSAPNGVKPKTGAGKTAASKQRSTAITLSSDDGSDAPSDAISEKSTDSDGADDDDSTRQSVQQHTARQGGEPPADDGSDENKPPPIPQKLLTRLLYESFEDKNMKIGREALNVFGKYMETFVREALARAIYERQDADGAMGGDGFLQVEDLEKLAPQLLLDF